MAFQAKKKSMGVSYAFWIFLGGLGAHRFYNGRTGSGIAMVVLFFVGATLALAGAPFVILPLALWCTVDLFLIPSWVSGHNARLMAELSGGASATMVAAA